MEKKAIISARDVEIQFSLRGKTLKAIRKCSLDLYEGETLAIVGESGSGKSVFTKTFVGMLDVNGKITGGSIQFEGRDMAKFTEKDWLGVRGKKISMVMQDPMTSLNPLKKIGKQIEESIIKHQGLKGEAAKVAVRNIRRDANEAFKKQEKNNEISEDDLKDATEQIQKITDKAIEKIDKAVENKTKEILTV